MLQGCGPKNWVTNLAQIESQPSTLRKRYDRANYFLLYTQDLYMKKLLTALISAAIIAMPLAVISSPAAAQGTSQAEPAKAKKAGKAKSKAASKAKKSKVKKAKKSASAASQ